MQYPNDQSKIPTAGILHILINKLCTEEVRRVPHTTQYTADWFNTIVQISTAILGVVVVQLGKEQIVIYQSTKIVSYW